MGVGIALAGGGIRGIAHAGVLKALEENNIKVEAIGGTSAGSIVARLICYGLQAILYICIVQKICTRHNKYRKCTIIKWIWKSVKKQKSGIFRIK